MALLRAFLFCNLVNPVNPVQVLFLGSSAGLFEDIFVIVQGVLQIKPRGQF